MERSWNSGLRPTFLAVVWKDYWPWAVSCSQKIWQAKNYAQWKFKNPVLPYWGQKHWQIARMLSAYRAYKSLSYTATPPWILPSSPERSLCCSHSCVSSLTVSHVARGLARHNARRHSDRVGGSIQLSAPGHGLLLPRCGSSPLGINSLGAVQSPLGTA